MAELTPQERLQPSLLDRLTDDEPSREQESREQRVLSVRKLRECVIRDMEWLLNTSNLGAEAEAYPHVTHSVLNYGLRDFAGNTLSGADVADIERQLRQAILDFEPRILRHTLKVKVLVADDQMNRNAMTFTIEGQLWAQPVPMELFLKTEVDLETGNVTIADHAVT